MIIACPACATRYVVPDSAIGADGRTVRCAKCRHSWFQAPGEGVTDPAPTLVEPPSPSPATAPEPVQNAAQAVAAAPTAPEPAPAAEPSAPVAEPAPVAVPPPVEPAATPVAPEPDLPFNAPVGAPADRAWDTPGGDFGEAASSFEHEPPFRPRRNPLRMWTMAAVSFALVVSALTAAVWWFGLPDWVPGAGPRFRKAVPGLELSFPVTKQDRRTLSNGIEYIGASGTITNVAKDPVEVPPLLIVLRDKQNRVVGYRDVKPPKPSLTPGEVVTVNEALTGVPREAVAADIGWKAR